METDKIILSIYAANSTVIIIVLCFYVFYLRRHYNTKYTYDPKSIKLKTNTSKSSNSSVNIDDSNINIFEEKEYNHYHTIVETISHALELMLQNCGSQSDSKFEELLAQITKEISKRRKTKNKKIQDKSLNQNTAQSQENLYDVESLSHTYTQIDDLQIDNSNDDYAKFVSRKRLKHKSGGRSASLLRFNTPSGSADYLEYSSEHDSDFESDLYNVNPSRFKLTQNSPANWKRVSNNKDRYLRHDQHRERCVTDPSVS